MYVELELVALHTWKKDNVACLKKKVDTFVISKKLHEKDWDQQWLLKTKPFGIWHKLLQIKTDLWKENHLLK